MGFFGNVLMTILAIVIEIADILAFVIVSKILYKILKKSISNSFLSKLLSLVIASVVSTVVSIVGYEIYNVILGYGFYMPKFSIHIVPLLGNILDISYLPGEISYIFDLFGWLIDCIFDGYIEDIPYVIISVLQALIYTLKILLKIAYIVWFLVSKDKNKAAETFLNKTPAFNNTFDNNVSSVSQTTPTPQQSQPVEQTSTQTSLDSSQTSEPNKDVVTNASVENSTVEELKKFKALLDEGLISEEDYNSKKKQLLNL